MTINGLANQYFSDIEAAGRADTENNLVSWLWFNCPANLRKNVAAEIESIRKRRDSIIVHHLDETGKPIEIIEFVGINKKDGNDTDRKGR